MPKHAKPLNAKQLEKWKPDPVRTLELIDGAVPGLCVRLSPGGELSWSMYVRVHGVRRRIAIGKALSLAQARRKAEDMRAAIRAGEDPSAEKRAMSERRRAAEAGVGTLGLVIATYYEAGPGATLRSKTAARALVERVFIDHLPRPALDVRSAELQLAVDGWRSKSSGLSAAACMRPIARWAAKRGLMAKGDPLEAPTQSAVKQRALAREEVAGLLRALGDSPHDIAARFMLLSGARRDEVCAATWGEIQGDVWTIPAGRRKDTRPNARRAKEDHVVVLSRQARELIEALRGDGNAHDGALVFAGARGAKLTNWPRWSSRIERQLGFEVTPHALRRTCATLAGDLGHPPHVVSALLGHRSIGGSLHAGYNQSRCHAEVADALQMVADLLDALASGGEGRVAIRKRTESRTNC